MTYILADAEPEALARALPESIELKTGQACNRNKAWSAVTRVAKLTDCYAIVYPYAI